MAPTDAPECWIRGGKVVQGGLTVAADVVIRDRTVVGIVQASDPPGAATIIDARDCYVFAGAIDVHTHLIGSVPTATRAAVCGGTTSVFTFTDHQIAEHPVDAVERAINEHIPGAACDVGVHAVIWDPTRYSSGTVGRLAGLGVTSIKVWLAYEELGIMIADGQLYDILREAASVNVVVLAHCENGSVLSAVRREMVAEGHTGLDYFADSRPAELEAEAVHRLLVLARLAQATVYVVHISGARPLAEVRRAKHDGQRCLAEVCTHHLVLQQQVYNGDDGLLYTVVPPLRSESDLASLWQGVRDGTLDVLASDHSPVHRAEKLTTDRDDFGIGRVGLPGVQLRLAVGFTAGVAEGRISIERLVEIACEMPARATGIYPRKGALVPGSDADVVVWDPNETIVAIEDSDFSPYSRIPPRGRPRFVLLNGQIVVTDGTYLHEPPVGRYLARRTHPAEAAPSTDWGHSEWFRA